jgi:hypothetical protein
LKVDIIVAGEGTRVAVSLRTRLRRRHQTARHYELCGKLQRLPAKTLRTRASYITANRRGRPPRTMRASSLSRPNGSPSSADRGP